MRSLAFSLSVGLVVLAETVSTQRCPQVRVENEGRLYRLQSTGGIRKCRKDFVFEITDGGCGSCRILKIGYAMAEPCKAGVEITFNNSRVVDVSQHTWILPNNIKTLQNIPDTTDGFVGEFNGRTSSIEIPYFAYSELGARLEIKLRYRESPEIPKDSPDMAILSNSAVEGLVPTFALVHSPMTNAIRAGVNTTGGNFLPFFVPIDESLRYQWKTVLFEYDAMAPDGYTGRLTLLVPGNPTSRMKITGNIQSLETPLVIGKGAFFSNFHGQMDFVRISRCSPVVNSNV